MSEIAYNQNEPYILMADDDEDDSLFMAAAFRDVGLMGAIKRVNNGVELVIMLKELIRDEQPLPALIILDLNMPRKNGKDVLKIIKSDERLTQIPTIIYSTSASRNEILESYRLGCNGYIVKPNNYNDIEKIAEKIKAFFIDTLRETGRTGSRSFTLDL
jgi:two-component system, response regulator